MDITAMISWYDESPDRLEQCIRDVARLGANRVVAVDGAYALFPGGQPYSDFEQGLRMSRVCHELGITFVEHVPNGVWRGNEVEKRKFMLEMAKASRADWLLIWDADYELERFEPSQPVADLLDASWDDFASVEFNESEDTELGWYPCRLFMRNYPHLHMGSNHYTYYPGSGDAAKSLILDEGSTVPATRLTGVWVRHGVKKRDPDRRAKQVEYYEERDTRGIET